jgi:hypothetical protein
MSYQHTIGDWLLYCANPTESPMPAALPNAAAEEELLRRVALFKNHAGEGLLWTSLARACRSRSKTIRSAGRRRNYATFHIARAE